jgi:hypothetical protein
MGYFLKAREEHQKDSPGNLSFTILWDWGERKKGRNVVNYLCVSDYEGLNIIVRKESKEEMQTKRLLKARSKWMEIT